MLHIIYSRHLQLFWYQNHVWGWDRKKVMILQNFYYFGHLTKSSHISSPITIHKKPKSYSCSAYLIWVSYSWSKVSSICKNFIFQLVCTLLSPFNFCKLFQKKFFCQCKNQVIEGVRLDAQLYKALPQMRSLSIFLTFKVYVIDLVTEIQWLGQNPMSYLPLHLKLTTLSLLIVGDLKSFKSPYLLNWGHWAWWVRLFLYESQVLIEYTRLYVKILIYYSIFQ